MAEETEPKLTPQRMEMITRLALAGMTSGQFGVAPPPGATPQDLADVNTVLQKFRGDGWQLVLPNGSRGTLRLSELICVIQGVSQLRGRLQDGSIPQGSTDFRIQYDTNLDLNAFLKPELVQKLLSGLQKN